VKLSRSGDQEGGEALAKTGLPKSVISEMKGLSIEEQNMILGAVGLSPAQGKQNKAQKSKNGRLTGAGSGETAAERRARRNAKTQRSTPADVFKAATASLGESLPLSTASPVEGKGGKREGGGKREARAKGAGEGGSFLDQVRARRDSRPQWLDNVGGERGGAGGGRDESAFFADTLPTSKGDQVGGVGGWVWVCERARERERGKGGREGGREGVCVCVLPLNTYLMELLGRTSCALFLERPPGRGG
jgi:hypothetical protein